MERMTRPISRRAFVAALTSGALAAIGVAACATPAAGPKPTDVPKPASAAPTAAPTAVPAPANTPQPAPAASTFTLAYIWPTKTIDPHQTLDNPTQIALVPMYEALVNYKTGSLEIGPELASSYEVSADGLKYTFKIRPNVKFHDGAVLDAQAVRKSYERMFKLGKAPGASVKKYITSFDTPDPQTLVVNMNSPYAPTLTTLGSTYIVSPLALDTHAGNDDAQNWLANNVAGTGPYRLKNWERDQSMTMVKFPEYWRGWSGKHVDTYVVRTVAEQATQRQLVQRGEAQMAMAIAANDLAQLKNDPNVAVFSDPSIREYLIRFDNQRPPLDDVNFRMALMYAFDYKTTVEQILAGNGTIPQGYVPTQYQTHNKALRPEVFDMAKAKQYLEASKYASGASIACTYIGNLDVQRQPSEIWQANLAKLGVTLRLNPQPWATMVERSQKPELRDNMGYFAFNYGNIDETFAQWQTLSSKSNAAWGNYGYKSDQIDDLLDKALVTIDNTARADLLKKAQELAREDAATVNALIFNDWVVAGKNVRGYKYDPGRPTIPPFYDMYLE